MTKLILRLEHAATGIGPFRERGSINGFSAKAHELAATVQGEQHPCASTDIPGFGLALWAGLRSFVIGVEYMSQLYHWLGDDLTPYLQRGYQVVLYTVPDEYIFNSISGLQVAFNPHQATSREVIY